MSRILHSDSGRLFAAQQDDVELPQHPHGNFVVYDNQGKAVFDERSHFAGKTPPSPPPAPDPSRPPQPSTGAAQPIRVTYPADGIVVNRGYAYYSQVFRSGPLAIVFVQVADGPPQWYRVHLSTRIVEPLGELIKHGGTGEGWYFSKEGSVYLCEGPRLRLVNPFSGEDHVVLDITGTHPGCRLFQAHSSLGGQIHSATVEQIVSDGAYPRIGTVVSRFGEQRFFESEGKLDESQIDASGKFLLIKEAHNNRIINLETGYEGFISDMDRALGHSDCGSGIAIGEADKPDPGMCISLDLATLRWVPLFETTNMGHMSVRAGRYLQTNPTFLNLVAPDGSGVRPILEHGMVIPPGTPDWKNYEYQPNGNLSPCGTVACYVTNSGGDRMDAWIVELPSG